MTFLNPIPLPVVFSFTAAILLFATAIFISVVLSRKKLNHKP